MEVVVDGEDELAADVVASESNSPNISCSGSSEIKGFLEAGGARFEAARFGADFVTGSGTGTVSSPPNNPNPKSSSSCVCLEALLVPDDR